MALLIAPAAVDPYNSSLFWERIIPGVMNVRSAPASASTARLLSFRETATLAGVSEKRLRKDLEANILASPLVWRLPDSRLCFPWESVVAIAAVYSGHALSGSMRRVALDRVYAWVKLVPAPNWGEFDVDEPFANSGSQATRLPTLIEIERPFAVDVEALWRDRMPKLASYMNGLEKIEEDPDILGGEAVFKGTRLSVYHVGKMIENGEKITNILEDYPYLDAGDVEFAIIYFRTHPIVGRPQLAEQAGAGVKTRSR